MARTLTAESPYAARLLARASHAIVLRDTLKTSAPALTARGRMLPVLSNVLAPPRPHRGGRGIRR
jgi:hypothetical protein